jgi:hypothetical protein
MKVVEILRNQKRGERRLLLPSVVSLEMTKTLTIVFVTLFVVGLLFGVVITTRVEIGARIAERGSGGGPGA